MEDWNKLERDTPPPAEQISQANALYNLKNASQGIAVQYESTSQDQTFDREFEEVTLGASTIMQNKEGS